MLILTGTAKSSARPSQGLATVSLPPATPPESFKPVSDEDGHWVLDAIGLHGLSNEDRGAVVTNIRSAFSAHGPEAEAAVKTIQLWESSAALAAAFHDADAAWTKKLGKAIGAAGGLAALVKVLAPPIAATGTFRFVDQTLKLGKMVSAVYEEATKKPEPLFGCRSAS